MFLNSDGYVDWNYQELEPTTAEAPSPVEPTDKQTPIEVVNTTLEAVELPSDEIAVEATTATQTLQNEITTTPKVGDSEIVLTKADLAQRLAKTPNEAKAVSGTLTRLGGDKMKAASIMTWTSKHDPEGKAWMPKDASRETWVVQAN